MVGGALQRTAIALPRSRDLRAPWSPQQNCAALRSSYASPVSRPRPQAGLSTWSASVSGVPYATSAPRKRLQTCNRPSDLGRAGSPAWHPSYSADATPSRIIHNVVQAGTGVTSTRSARVAFFSEGSTSAERISIAQQSCNVVRAFHPNTSSPPLIVHRVLRSDPENARSSVQ